MFTIALKYDLENPADTALRRVGNKNILLSHVFLVIMNEVNFVSKAVYHILT